MLLVVGVMVFAQDARRFYRPRVAGDTVKVETILVFPDNSTMSTAAVGTGDSLTWIATDFDVSQKAPLASPTFTGTVTAPLIVPTTFQSATSGGMFVFKNALRNRLGAFQCKVYGYDSTGTPVWWFGDVSQGTADVRLGSMAGYQLWFTPANTLALTLDTTGKAGFGASFSSGTPFDSTVKIDGSFNVTGNAKVAGALTLGTTQITADGAELNYVDGVTSAIQTQLDARASRADTNSWLPTWADIEAKGYGIGTGDIEGIVVTGPITGGGTSGSPTIGWDSVAALNHAKALITGKLSPQDSATFLLYVKSLISGKQAAGTYIVPGDTTYLHDQIALRAPIASPTFTGTVSGITKAMVGLSNVTNESKATMFTSPAFTGTPIGITSVHVGLGNVTNESKATMFTSPTFTGTTTLATPFTLGGVSVTPTGAELNYVDGVTSAIQTQLNAKIGYSYGSGEPTSGSNGDKYWDTAGLFFWIKSGDVWRQQP
jgi:hypothetical protein